MVEPGGTHIIVDYWGVDSNKLTSCVEIDDILRASATIAGATVLSSKYHSFGDGFGITGVLMLQESHITLHTWSESGYCALDIFMCGNSKPEEALKVLDSYFIHSHKKVQIIKRGEM